MFSLSGREKTLSNEGNAVSPNRTVFYPSYIYIYMHAPKGGSFGPDIPANVRSKTSVRPSTSLKKQALWHGHPALTSMKKLRSEKVHAFFGPMTWFVVGFLSGFLTLLPLCAGPQHSMFVNRMDQQMEQACWGWPPLSSSRSTFWRRMGGNSKP